MNAKEIMTLAVKSADDKKAEDIKVLDISELTTIADYFVICSANSGTQMRAIADEVEDRLKEQGLLSDSREGKDSAYWILLDYADVIVHIFNKESREFYAIEHLWADAKEINIDEIL